MINFSDSKFEAGVDEAGRGSLAGPVTAAAVILPRDYRNDALDDSFKCSLNPHSTILETVLSDLQTAMTNVIVDPYFISC